MLTVQWLTFKSQIEKISGYHYYYKINPDGTTMLLNNVRRVLSVIDYKNEYKNPMKEIAPHLETCNNWLKSFIQQSKYIKDMKKGTLDEYKKLLTTAQKFAETEAKYAKTQGLKREMLLGKK